MTILKADLIAAVRDYAVANCEMDGSDFLVECWTDEDIAEAIKGAKSKTAAIAAVRKAVKVLVDAPAGARSAGDLEMSQTHKPKTLDDRVILAPGKAEDVRPTKEGSKRALLVQALQHGATIERLMEVVRWNRDTVSSALRTDLKAIGLGVERRNGMYFLIMPDGLKRLPVREAKSSRADAPLSDCK